MKNTVIRGALAGLLVYVTAAAAVAQPTTVGQTTKTGAATEKTTTLTGTVVEVDGKTLVVKMASGDIRMFTPPADRRFIIDGKELTLSELQPGTKLTATVTETATPVTERTVQTLEGTVWYAAGSSVILTLPNGENKMYTVKAGSPVKFKDGSGKDITVSDLRKGMKIAAVKITEAPSTQLATTAKVTGTAPKAAAVPAPAPAPAPAAPKTLTAPSQTAMTPPAEAPKKLPKTASPLPLLGLTGLSSLLAGLGLTIRRRRASR